MLLKNIFLKDENNKNENYTSKTFVYLEINSN